MVFDRFSNETLVPGVPKTRVLLGVHFENVFAVPFDWGEPTVQVGTCGEIIDSVEASPIERWVSDELDHQVRFAPRAWGGDDAPHGQLG